MTRSLLAGALALLLPTTLGAQSEAQLPDAAALDAALTAFDVPGVAMASLASCAMDEVVVAGTADLSTSTPVRPDTAFEAASLSKPVFAYLVLKLADEGIIDLDAPLAATFYYPRIPDTDAYARITPRMILTHRTGLPNWVDEGTDFHAGTAPIPFEAEPGVAFTYSGEGFQLLQAFVEHQTGRTLQQLFRDRLGTVMPNSTFALPLPETVTPSRGYRDAQDEGRGLTNLKTRGMAASSLVTTAGDYARFLSHVCRGEGLTPATQTDMLTPQSPASGEAPFPTSWGLGWMIGDLGGLTLVGHGGNNDEYRAFAGYMRETGDGIVILTNGANGQALIEVLLLPPAQ
ncbi:serine hydrolase domain-containing protein [Pontivivens ytuae]|uniref:Beta-lactamase family protein n=1 Tax=Pontivivens ytuae TaxID=2789856 RepID=A0A7S9LVL5_9RHOB|nr:serine hydrolase domain-containing protein [Pontivivens ytuae]QPH55795.1 beta-lactamase family protein [Pontivivens ytuae]